MNRFLKQNPKFNFRKQKLVSADQKDSHDLEDLTEYFNKLKRVMKEKSIIAVDVWNMDKTRFCIGCRRAQMVIALDEKKLLCILNSDNCNYITLIECINATGEMILPLLIIFEGNILHKWCQHNDLNREILINISKSDYSNNNLAINWLHYFIHYMQNKKKSA